MHVFLANPEPLVLIPDRLTADLTDPLDHGPCFTEIHGKAIILHPYGPENWICLIRGGSLQPGLVARDNAFSVRRCADTGAFGQRAIFC
jgi:hypothetical protein